MSAKTTDRALSAKQTKILKDLGEVGSVVNEMKKELDKSVKKRNDLIVRGAKSGLSYAQLGAAAGIRRETAHYAALRTTQRKNGSPE